MAQLTEQQKQEIINKAKAKYLSGGNVDDKQRIIDSAKAKYLNVQPQSRNYIDYAAMQQLPDESSSGFVDYAAAQMPQSNIPADATPFNPNTVTEKKPGFIQSVVQAIVDPILKTGVTGAAAAQTILPGLKAAGQYILGDKAGGNKTLQEAQPVLDKYKQGIDFGYLGNIKPVGYKDTGQRQTLPESMGTTLGTGVQMGMLASPGVGSGNAAKNIFTPLASKSPVIAKALTFGKSVVPRMIESGVASGTMQAAKNLEKNEKVSKNVPESAAVGAAIPAITTGLGWVGSKLFGKEGWMRSALGLNGTQAQKLNDQLKNTNYNNIDDFAIKKGLVGSREQMAEKLDDIYNTNIKTAKPEVLAKIKEPIKNNKDYVGLAKELLKKYDGFNQEKDYNEILKISKSPEISAMQLDRLRYYADASLPRGAYRGANPPAEEAMEEAINNIRRTLEKLDKTGTIKDINTNIRMSISLGQVLNKTSGKDVQGKAMWEAAKVGAAGIGIGGTAALGANPIFTAPVAGYMVTKSIPSIASRIAQTGASATNAIKTPVGQALGNIAGEIGRKATIFSAPKIADSIKSIFGKK